MDIHLFSYFDLMFIIYFLKNIEEELPMLFLVPTLNFT